jgi:hypothetical protein
MNNILRVLLIGIGIGAAIVALLAQAERKRLQSALADAELRLSKSAILPDHAADFVRETQALAWERAALGIPSDETLEDDEDD